MASILIRQLEPGDRAFVLDSAWRSIREHPYARAVSPHVFSDLLTPFLDTWQTVVAADDDAPQVIHAWLCYRDANRVAWGFTKPDRRQRGIMRALLAHASIATAFEVLFPTQTHFERLRPRYRPYLALEAP